MVVSTSTFAFNQMSSQYMKNSPKELADMVFGLPRISKELKKLEPYGYHIKSVLSKVDAFITHCGMNSVSESLYMAAPMILYPQTGEQCAVARRVTEIGAGYCYGMIHPEVFELPYRRF